MNNSTSKLKIHQKKKVESKSNSKFWRNNGQQHGMAVAWILLVLLTVMTRLKCGAGRVPNSLVVGQSDSTPLRLCIADVTLPDTFCFALEQPVSLRTDEGVFI